ncbi:fumarylacetoacetate hydrolase family protein [Alkalibacter rhizosphaerae]|uniref:Fumarylacetoacetate hydrolase family protein n=1 Tax=Alkalibacter rhizosphaerae TaxID=2815577 RepID=A0A974XDA6_9FIRM|nr:fumarylacetoacetate hydrolase family protein [Alkalibacter rhizosphaerae]QSX07616.1 fumarylacetoacetate hydrolase family protein [Alkalibacter rhizosphaerae]
MKIANYRMKNEDTARLGILTEKGMIPLESLGLPAGDVPKDMIALIDNFDGLERPLQIALAQDDLLPVALEETQLLTPIPYPRRNVFCLGKNYVEHAQEMKDVTGTSNDLPQYPIYFTKVAYPAMGPEDVLENFQEITDTLDYEVELAVIIGKKGKNIPAEDALDYIFGYTIGNDISVRNIQKQHMQWFKGKSFDTSCPIGPVIVTKEEIAFPPDLAIKSTVNGEVRQESRTSKLIFDIPTILSDLTQGITLYPGDIILTGTPAGVGMGFHPPKTLKPGDEVCCEIEKIGKLVNYVAK